MKLLKGLIINFQFFTSIPIPYNVPMEKEYIEKAIKTFPILGMIQGFIYSILLYTCLTWTPLTPLSSAFIIWFATIVLTGGIHLDGWIDASDAYFSFQSKEKRLEIMKDPRTGAFGVISVIVLLSARFLFLYEIILNFHSNFYLYIMMIPFFSKMVMGIILLTVKSAKEEGLGTFFQKSATNRTLLIYPIYILILFSLLFFLFKEALEGAILFLSISALIVIFLFRKLVHWFGGLTGDLIGASVEGTEILLWMTLWLLPYFVMD